MATMTQPRVDLTPLINPTRGQGYFSPRPDSFKLEYGGARYRFDPGYGEIIPKNRKHSPQELFTHFFGDDGRSGKAGEAGIRPTFGDHRDVQIHAEAVEAYAQTQFKADMALKLSHMDRVKKEKEAGLPVTPPSQQIMEAMQRIAQREKVLGYSSAFPCTHCAAPFADKVQLQAHIGVIHPEYADKLPQFVPAANEPFEIHGIDTGPQTSIARPQAAQGDSDARFADINDKINALAEIVQQALSRKKPGPKPKVKAE